MVTLVVEAPVVNEVVSCCHPDAYGVQLLVSLAPVPLSPTNT